VKHISVFPFVMITAALVILVTMGIGYGLWFENLSLAGTIETGTVGAEFLEQLDGGLLAYECHDNEYEDSSFAWKDVGDVSMEIDPNDPTIAYVTVENAYPLYAADCSFKYKITGSVPVHLEWFEFIPDYNAAPGDASLTNCQPLQASSGTSLGTTCDELNATLSDGAICSQYHSGDVVPNNLQIVIKQPAEEGTRYTFAFKIRLNQYNESACP